MPRPPRIDLPGVPQHLVIRGNNRGDLFRDDNDRTVFLRYLRHAVRTSDSQVHAFVLMTNHVHLLATGHGPGGLSRLIQSLGRRYSRYVNRAHERTGTLFEGRFRSSIVDSDRYLFACMRYIELNPVRAGIVDDPGDYPWSSFRENAGFEAFGWLAPRNEYFALAEDAAACAMAYRALFARPLDAEEIDAIRNSIRKRCPLGPEGFLRRIGMALGRRVEPMPQGRPRKSGKGI